MNVDKNKSIRKGFSFSKRMFPAVGALLITTQMGSGKVHGGVGVAEATKNQATILKDKESLNNLTSKYTDIYADNIRNISTPGTPVISAAIKFVIGTLNLDKEFIFINPTDQCEQVLKHDGTSVIIVNNPTKEQVLKIRDKIKELDPNMNKLSITAIKKLIEYMEKEGIKDFYSSDTQYVTSNLKRKTDEDRLYADGYCGSYQRNGKPYEAYRYPDKVRFHSLNTKSAQIFPNGAIIVRNLDNIQAVQPDIFIDTYTHVDGKTIKQKDLKQIDVQKIKKIENEPSSEEAQNEQPAPITKRRKAID